MSDLCEMRQPFPVFVSGMVTIKDFDFACVVPPFSSFYLYLWGRGSAHCFFEQYLYLQIFIIVFKKKKWFPCR